jgi:hypothetical protein
MKAKIMMRGKAKDQPPKAQGVEYIYSPPAWRVCNKCDGKGRRWHPIIGTCSWCHGLGRIPIHYTPEQWQKAGGVLNDDTPVWVMSDGAWIILASYGNFKNTNAPIIIATSAGKPPKEEK